MPPPQRKLGAGRNGTSGSAWSAKSRSRSVSLSTKRKSANEKGNTLLEEFLVLLVGDDPTSVHEFLERHDVRREELERLRRDYSALVENLRRWCTQSPFRNQAETSQTPDPNVFPLAIPGHHLLGEIGRGGVGVVYKAEELATGRKVAVKVIPVRDPHATKKRFQREIASIASARSPHIVTLYQSGTANGVFFYTMELLEGETFEATLARWRQYLTPERFRRAAEILAVASGGALLYFSSITKRPALTSRSSSTCPLGQ